MMFILVGSYRNLYKEVRQVHTKLKVFTQAICKSHYVLTIRQSDFYLVG